ncbi:MAG: hypothetical protein IKT70_00625 [Clostridia bacterium]|nr:hypothetical protein [Clostridia bacterium]
MSNKNSEKLFDMIGEIDDKYIEDAEKKKKPVGRIALSVAGAASVVCIMIFSPLGMNLLGRSHENSLPPLVPPDTVSKDAVTNEWGLVVSPDKEETDPLIYAEIITDTRYPADTKEDLLPPDDGGNVTATLPEAPDGEITIETAFEYPVDTNSSAETGKAPAVSTYIGKYPDTAEEPNLTVPVYVWYVDGNEVISATVTAERNTRDIFAAWKDKNGIGPEVELIGVKVTDNSKTEYVDYGGESIAKHTAATEWYMTVTVSVELENYFDSMGKELLYESLEKTMIGFADKRNLVSYELVLE